jgi:hypothetical protein
MPAPCETRISYTEVLAHLVGGVEEGMDSSGRFSNGVVDLGQSTCVMSLVLEYSDQVKSSDSDDINSGVC